MRRAEIIGVNVILTLLFSLVALIAFEMLPFGEEERHRLLYFSIHPWKVNNYDDDFFISLQPNKTIRTYAKYGKNIDYDITFKTDSNGFRSSGLETNELPIVSVVGDSYTMGSGGPNWVESLRTTHGKSRTFFFYNNGVSGTGIQHWKTLIDYLHREREIDRFVIVMIEEDLSRKKWHSIVASDGRVVFCVIDDCTPMNIITNEELDYLRSNAKEFFHDKVFEDIQLFAKFKIELPSRFDDICEAETAQ